jgi:hypothetical protein
VVDLPRRLAGVRRAAARPTLRALRAGFLLVAALLLARRVLAEVFRIRLPAVLAEAFFALCLVLPSVFGLSKKQPYPMAVSVSSLAFPACFGCANDSVLCRADDPFLLVIVVFHGVAS